jgi:hypothetical protein
MLPILSFINSYFINYIVGLDPDTCFLTPTPIALTLTTSLALSLSLSLIPNPDPLFMLYSVYDSVAFAPEEMGEKLLVVKDLVADHKGSWMLGVVLVTLLV